MWAFKSLRNDEGGHERCIEFFEVSVPLVLLPSRPSAARERLVAHRVMITHTQASQTRHLLMPRAARLQSDGADGAWHAVQGAPC